MAIFLNQTASNGRQHKLHRDRFNDDIQDWLQLTPNIQRAMMLLHCIALTQAMRENELANTVSINSLDMITCGCGALRTHTRYWGQLG